MKCEYIYKKKLSTRGDGNMSHQLFVQEANAGHVVESKLSTIGFGLHTALPVYICLALCNSITTTQNVNKT